MYYWLLQLCRSYYAANSVNNMLRDEFNDYMDVDAII